MSKGLRLSEAWYRRGLWLVAMVFAGFLIGLGGTVVGDLPKVEQRYSIDDFMEPGAGARARAAIEAAQRAEKEAQAALEQARLKVRVAQANTQSARETFNNWLATRKATERADQDPELIARTQRLDELKAAERQAQAQAETQEQARLNAQQAAAKVQTQLEDLERAAQDRLVSAVRAQELRVFLYRLALTLPLLAVAGWLFARKRKSTYWPFVWGFIFFALFAFFVELVPYLPSYGGYVRYIVGIGITILVGRYAILALNRYLERQRLAEQQPDALRREELSYDVALARLSKGVCPGCERPLELKNPAIDFCPHCGIGVHNHCGRCDTRKNAFARFCHACGAAAGAAPHESPRAAVPGEKLGAAPAG